MHNANLLGLLTAPTAGGSGALLGVMVVMLILLASEEVGWILFRYAKLAWLYWEFVHLTILIHLFSNGRKLLSKLLYGVAAILQLLCFCQDVFGDFFKVHKIKTRMPPNVES